MLIDDQDCGAQIEDSVLDNENYWRPDRDSSNVDSQYDECENRDQGYGDAFWNELIPTMSENRVRIPLSVMEDLTSEWVTFPQAPSQAGCILKKNEFGRDNNSNLGQCSTQ